MTVLLALTSSVALLLGADDAAQDLSLLQGTWSVVSAERSGKKMPDDKLKKMQVTIKDDSITINEDTTNPDQRSETAKLKLDPSTKPKSLEITPSKGDKPLLGIYELDGDTLKICWAMHTGDKTPERPKEFATKQNTKIALLVLKRVEEP